MFGILFVLLLAISNQGKFKDTKEEVFVKSIFITGGLLVLGWPRKELLNRDWVVGVCGRDISKIESTLNQNQKFYGYKADVTNSEEIKKVIKEFSIRNAGLDVVVANAGISVGAKDGS